MATVLRVTHRDVLLALKAAVKAGLGFPDERCRLLAEDESVNYRVQGDQFVVIRWMGFRPDKPFVVGGGRVDYRMTGRAILTLFTRLFTDESNSNELWLTDADNGHMIFESTLLSALAVTFLTDNARDTGNSLLTQPMEVRSCGVPEKERAEKEWGKSAFELLFEFDFAVDQAII